MTLDCSQSLFLCKILRIECLEVRAAILVSYVLSGSKALKFIAVDLILIQDGRS